MSFPSCLRISWKRNTESSITMSKTRNPTTAIMRSSSGAFSMTIVVALDRSGSMAAPVEGGKTKMDLANLGTMEVLNLLHKSQIMLVEKDENCESSAWRMDDVKGIRNDDNFYAKYMAGAYGAVPQL